MSIYKWGTLTYYPKALITAAGYFIVQAPVKKVFILSIFFILAFVKNEVPADTSNYWSDLWPILQILLQVLFTIVSWKLQHNPALTAQQLLPMMGNKNNWVSYCAESFITSFKKFIALSFEGKLKPQLFLIAGWLWLRYLATSLYSIDHTWRVFKFTLWQNKLECFWLW